MKSFVGQKDYLSKKDKRINEASEESFPTSDPPAWTLGTELQLELGKEAEARTLTQLLAREHSIVRKAMSTFSKLIDTIDSGKSLPTRETQAFLKAYLRFIEVCHEQKELVLLPILRQGEEHLSDYLINDLKSEQQIGKEILLQLSVVLNQHTETGATKEKLLLLLKELRHVHVNHNAKEEGHVLPMINKALTQTEQQKLFDLFRKMGKDGGDQVAEALVLATDTLLKKLS